MYSEFKKVPSTSKFYKLANVEGYDFDAYLPTQICCLMQYITDH